MNNNCPKCGFYLISSNCPKCGFYLISSNCPKCGYEKEHIYIEKYKTEQSNLEFFLKDDYLKIIHNKNKKLIILLGPLYFSYYKFPITSIIFTSIELFIHYIMSINLTTGGFLSTTLLILIFTMDLIFLRIIYLSFYNTLLLNLQKNKLSKIKQKDNYKELIYKYKPKSIKILITTILIIFIILIIANN